MLKTKVTAVPGPGELTQTVLASAEPPAKSQPSRRANALLWAAQILLAALFAIAALPKLGGAQSQVRLFSQLGAGQWLRYLVGIAELAGATALLIPRLSALAAAGLAADMLGATIINAAVLHNAAVVLTTVLCAAFVIIAARRRPA